MTLCLFIINNPYFHLLLSVLGFFTVKECWGLLFGTPRLTVSKVINYLPFGAPEFTPDFLWSLCYSIFSFMCLFCGPLFDLLYFFYWPLCCLFFDLRMHNYPFGIFKLFLKWLWLFCCRPFHCWLTFFCF